MNTKVLFFFNVFVIHLCACACEYVCFYESLMLFGHNFSTKKGRFLVHIPSTDKHVRIDED